MGYKIIKNYLTKNDCYKKAVKRSKTAGIVKHSTGCNNPNLRRYVPNAELFGPSGSNHWDMSGLAKCVHFMIGKDKAGRVCIVQTLPLSYRCWGCGSGAKGSYNNTHVQYEILEDGHKDGAYYREAMAAAEWLDKYILDKYGLAPSSIVSHKEAGKKGYATGHGDPENWMDDFGDSMKACRARVTSAIKGETDTKISDTIPSTAKASAVYEVAEERDPGMAGTYKVKANRNLNLRTGAGTGHAVIAEMPHSSEVKCYGYYTEHDDTTWLLVAYKTDSKTLTGYASARYLKRV